MYHSAPSVLKPLDDIQKLMLSEIGVSEEEAIVSYSLAPLQMRRHISMLGLLHKVASGIAPKPIGQLFCTIPLTLRSYGFGTSRRLHNLQIQDPVVPSHPQIIKRSVFGLVKVYNNLPPQWVENRSVIAF